MMSKYLEKIVGLYNEISNKQINSLPLCAAENAISPFSKIPLDSFLQEKYIMGGIMDYSSNNNFVESKDLFKFYNVLNEQCSTLFGSSYADARTLSGVNAVMLLIMSLFNYGDTIYITAEDCGGHTSMPLICKRLGIHTIELPYDYECMDYDYVTANNYMDNHKIDGILICPSDILAQPKLNLFNLHSKCILIYDATQTLGLLASNVNDNPLKYFSSETNFILMGATHKTLPGPTCGLIMTKNKALAKRFDEKINPDYLRNVQFHQILCLMLVLAEMETFGMEYSMQILSNANFLGHLLEEQDFQIVYGAKKNKYTDTHQLFLSLNKDEIPHFIDTCAEYGITMNARYRKIYKDSGVRIGTQEITRYGWKKEEMLLISNILSSIKKYPYYSPEISEQIKVLTRNKHISYTFENDVFSEVHAILHNT